MVVDLEEQCLATNFDHTKVMLIVRVVVFCTVRRPLDEVIQ